MAKDLITEIIDPKAIQELMNATAELNKLTEAHKILIAEIVKTKGTPAQTMADYTKETAAANRAQAELLKSEVQLQKAAQAHAKMTADVTDSYSKASKQLNEYRKEYKDLAFRHQENTERAKELKKAINDLDSQLKRTDATVGQHQRNVGNYSGAIQGMWKNILGAAAGMFTFQAALTAANKVIEASGDLTDKFEEVVSGLKEGLMYTARAIANWDWKNFSDGMQRAIGNGVQFARTMDAIQERMWGLETSAVKADERISELMLTFKDKSKPAAERLAAEQEMLAIKQGVVNDKVRAAKDNYEALLTLISKNAFISSSVLKAFTEDYAGSMDKVAKSGDQGAVIMGRWNKVSDEHKKQLRTAAQAVFNTKKEYNDFQVSLMKTDNSIDTNIDKINQLAQSWQDYYIKYNKALRSGELVGPLTEEEQRIQDHSRFEDTKLAKSITNQDILKKSQQDLLNYTMQKRWEDTKNFEDNEKNKTKIAEEEERKRQALIEAEFQAANTAVQIAITMADTEYNTKKGLIDEEYAELEKQHNSKKISDKKYQEEKEKIDQRERKLLHDKAEREKTFAIFGAVINTAEAVAKALNNPYPLNLILAALSAALGAAQIANIRSQPVPKYAKGRKGGKEEIAIVGEAGPEVIHRPGKSAELVTSETLTHLEAGASVIPIKDLETMTRSFAFTPVVNDKGQTGYDLSKIAADFKESADNIVKAIREKDSRAIVDMKGVYDGIAFANYVNQNFKQ